MASAATETARSDPKKPQASKTLVFLWKKKVFRAPDSKKIGFPKENEGFQSPGLPEQRLPASKTLVFLRKMKVFRDPS